MIEPTLTIDFFESEKSAPLMFTEQGGSLEFARACKGSIAFIAEDRRWIAWDGVRWDSSCAHTIAEMRFDDLIRAYLHAASEATDLERRKTLLERTKMLSSAAARKNALALAQSKLAVSRRQFDRDALDLLVTPSGIVDLRTGELSANDPSRMLTQCTAVPYNPDAPWPARFGALVSALAGHDFETELWLWRAIGYSLTGHVQEDAFFYLRGSGSNGKSTLLKALHAILGDYAHKLDIRFLTAGNDGYHASEFAALRGKRLVITSEVERGQKLAISRLKDLTGGDVQKHRRMREDADAAPEFDVRAKLWAAGNYDLVVHGNDEGTWRRIHKIESAHRFERSGIRDSLVKEEGEGILKAAVGAAGEWYRCGLGDSPRVRAATEEYRRQQDLLGQFFSDCLVFEPGAFIAKDELNAEYLRWRSEEGIDHGVGPKEMAGRLAERGCSQGRKRVTLRNVKSTPRGWFGVRRADPRA